MTFDTFLLDFTAITFWADQASIFLEPGMIRTKMESIAAIAPTR